MERPRTSKKGKNRDIAREGAKRRRQRAQKAAEERVFQTIKDVIWKKIGGLSEEE